jgi:hypothetical protein
MGIEETSDGSLWLAESRGVVHIPALEVQRALDNPSYRVKYRLFDSFDGLTGTIAATGAFLKEIQGTDGELWFLIVNVDRPALLAMHCAERLRVKKPLKDLRSSLA